MREEERREMRRGRRGAVEPLCRQGRLPHWHHFVNLDHRECTYVNPNGVVTPCVIESLIKLIKLQLSPNARLIK
jgi:hypothetical protein